MKLSEVTMEWLESHLEGWEGDGNTATAWCPVHADVGTSHKGLSISRVGKKILCKCHSPHCGATLPQVVAALNGHVEGAEEEVKVRVRTTRSRIPGMEWWVSRTYVPEHIWEELGCVEEGGGIAFLFAGEDIRKTRVGKDFRWIPAKGITPSLWPMPEEELPEHIWITEGESDCGTARLAGHHAYAATKGAQTPLSLVEFQALASRGVSEVTIATDRGGEVFAAHLAKAATDALLTVNIVDLNRVVDPFWTTKDINDVWKETQDVKEYNEIISRATYRIEEQSPFQTHAEAKEIAEEEKTWIVEELVAPGDKVMIAGPPKAYKTWVSLDLTRALLTGAPFLSRAEWSCAKPRRVLLVQEEGSRHAFAERLNRIEESENLFFMHKTGFAFTDEGAVSSLIHAMKAQEIDVVIFDPLQRMIPGINENDSAETAVVWNEVFRMQLALPHLVVVVIHHANKGGEGQESIRGSSRHAGEVDLWLIVNKVDKGVIKIQMDGRDTYTDLGPGDALEGRVEIGDDSFTVNTQDLIVSVRATQGETKKREVLKAVGDGCETRTQIMQYTGMSDNTVLKYLETLEGEELVTVTSHGPGKPNTYSVSDPK